MLNEHWPHWQIPDLHRYFVDRYRMQYFQEVQSVWLTSAGAMEVFARRAQQERDFGDHSIIRGGGVGRSQPLLRDLPTATKRKVSHREPLEIGPCECGD